MMMMMMMMMTLMMMMMMTMMTLMMTTMMMITASDTCYASVQQERNVRELCASVLLSNTAGWIASSLVPANRAVSWKLSSHCPSQEKFSTCLFLTNQVGISSNITRH